MSEILKKLRTLHNYSQSYVAEYLNVSRQMYIKYESGEVEPSVKIITKLCQLYKVSYSTILGELNFSQEKTDDLYNTQKSEDFYVASPDVCYGEKKHIHHCSQKQ